MKLAVSIPPILCVLLGATMAVAQEKSEKEFEIRVKKNSQREEVWINRAAQRTYFPETVRDRWMKEMTAHFPTATVVDARGDADADRWFTALSGGGETWSREGIRIKPFRELYERAAKDLGAPGAEALTRQQFQSYAAGALRAGTSPLWKNKDAEVNSLEEADRVFKDFDTNRDGTLQLDEQSETLQQTVRQVDRNADGLIDSAEYRVYFESQLLARRDHPELLQQTPKKEKEKDREVPAIIERGPMPSNPTPTAPTDPDLKLPKWFPTLDEDADGQIGLYEWRQSGRASTDFLMLDLNGDFYLTPKELARYLADHPDSPLAGNKLPNARR